MRQYPVVIYAHGSGGTLMNDGNDLRQMAELGLAVVSLEYNQTNETAFTAQFEALLHYLGRQKWANTNATAWAGFSLGANRTLDFALQHPDQQPQLLVQLSGAGVNQSTLNPQLSTNLHCLVLLVHGEQDEVFPVQDTKRLFSILQTNGLPVELKIIPGLPHGMEPERGIVFRSIGEYCLTHLTSKHAWQNYHSIAQWQAEAPPFWWFCLPAVAWAVGWLVWLRCRKADSPPAPAGQSCCSASISSPAGAAMPTESQAKPSLCSFWWKFGRRGSAALPWSGIAFCWLAVLLAIWALAETAIRLVPPHFAVGDRTLSIARRFLVQLKERSDFEYLAAQPIWQGQKLKTLLTHVELAGYNRELINWQLDDKVYREHVLSPIIEPSTLPPSPASAETSNIQRSTFNAQPSNRLDWRRPLWEEFYPRIRHESSPEDAARIVVRHLRERVTIADVQNPSRDVSAIWLRQITDAAGFQLIYVAALRSVGVPARLNPDQQAEFWDGTQWRMAPAPWS